MKVLVSDTSVLIDLERGKLVESCFRLPFSFAVPDLLYEQELKNHGGTALIELGLVIEELDGSGVALALSYRHGRNSLSLPDSFAMALARINSWTLLSGDRELRDLAFAEGIACHGVLWLLDRMLEEGVKQPNDLRAGLQKIAEHPRCRLPKGEVQKRLQLYSGA